MTIENLYFSYKNLIVFENFNFQSDADIIAFKGPSGCGKSTLLKVFSNNIKSYKSEVSQPRNNSFLVLQEDSLCPWLTGTDNILKFMDLKSDYRKPFFFKHIEGFVDKYAYEMSFGQRRMVEIFRAVLFDPDILMLDEPFNYLDQVSRNKISEILLEFVGERKKKIILTSHYAEDFQTLKPKTFLFDGKFPITRLTDE